MKYDDIIEVIICPGSEANETNKLLTKVYLCLIYFDKVYLYLFMINSLTYHKNSTKVRQG